MKAEDIERMWNESKHANDPFDMPEWRLQSTNGRDLLERFARTCEQHVIERAKAIIKIPGECGACDGKGQCEHYPDDGVLEDCPDCEGLGREPLDWSALDAEVAKENET